MSHRPYLYSTSNLFIISKGSTQKRVIQGKMIIKQSRLTTVTASLTSDSPKTMMKSVSFTWTSSNTAITATGSTAEIRAPNNRKSIKPAFTFSSAHTHTHTDTHTDTHTHTVQNKLQSIITTKLAAVQPEWCGVVVKDLWCSFKHCKWWFTIVHLSKALDVMCQMSLC